MGFSWDYLFQGFVTAFSLQNLFWALVGSFIGTLVGVLPGIGPASGIAILLPMTTVLPPTSAIIMMAAIYYGAMYGGSTTAIVVNIPGEASSVATAIDGYEMAKQGRAGPALAISAISSFVAGTLGLVGLTFFAPMLANFAVVFGPPEYFALMFMGLSLIISLSGRALLKGVISMALGLMAALIGQDPLTGAARLTFGSSQLTGRGRFHQRDRGALRDQRGDDQCGAENHRHQSDEDRQLDADLGRYEAVHWGQCSAAQASVSSWDSSPGAPPRSRRLWLMISKSGCRSIPSDSAMARSKGLPPLRERTTPPPPPDLFRSSRSGFPWRPRWRFCSEG